MTKKKNKLKSAARQTNEQESPVQTDGTGETPSPENPVKTKSQAFDIVLGKAQVMAFAMEANQEDLTKGGDAVFVEAFKASCREVKDLNTRQENLKAENKACTDALKKQVVEINRFMKEASSYIKMVIPQKRWVAFGITAKW